MRKTNLVRRRNVRKQDNEYKFWAKVVCIVVVATLTGLLVSKIYLVRVFEAIQNEPSTFMLGIITGSLIMIIWKNVINGEKI